MYDSVGQFYPWRKFAADSIRSGTIPLWNPYQFCGTPFVANSQSAVFYPLNFIYYIVPIERAAGINVLLHLILAASFMWLFLRELGVSNGGGAIGGITYAFSTWQVTWLHLPTFLATSCWLPLVLVLTRRLFVNSGANPIARVLSLGICLGICILGGHLQIAFYVVLAAILLAIYCILFPADIDSQDTGETGSNRLQIRSRTLVGKMARLVAALVIAGMIAGPQVLSSLELSRQSHRRTAPSAAGYAAYTAYAVSPGALATLFVPDMFGNPSAAVKDSASGRIVSTYVGQSRGGMYFNYAEGAMYVGLLPLCFAAFAVIRRRQEGRLIPYFGGLAILSLLLALGTPVDALFYFYLPGFGQSGSPGRSLVLWAFALAALASLGYEKAAKDNATPVKTAVVSFIALGLFGICVYYLALSQLPDGIRADSGFGRQLVFLAISAGFLLLLCLGKARTGAIAIAPFVLLIADLFATGINYNPTSPPGEVYPSTAAIDAMRDSARHDRIMPINRNWSFAGPQAILPPNGAMVFGLRDVQGYDSLFPGQYKDFMNRLAGQDSSPQEVGNMVFAKNPMSPLTESTGVKTVASLEPLSLPGAAERFVDGIYLYTLSSARGRASYLTARGTTTPVDWLEDAGTRVSLGTMTDSPATLRLADQFYPGWVATIDGSPATIERDGIFRKVSVPAGKHVLRFTYCPSAFQFGLYLMLIAFASCACYIASEFSRGIQARIDEAASR